MDESALRGVEVPLPPLPRYFSALSSMVLELGLLTCSVLRSSLGIDHHRESAVVLVLRYILKFLKLLFACGTNLFADRILSACIPLAKNKKRVVRQIMSTAAKLYCRKTEDRGEMTTKWDKTRMKRTKPKSRISYLRFRACSRAAFCLRRSSKMRRSRNVAASAAGWKGSSGSFSATARDEARACCDRPRAVEDLGGISEDETASGAAKS